MCIPFKLGGNWTNLNLNFREYSNRNFERKCCRDLANDQD